MKIAILGAGEVGSHIALFCAMKKLGEINLLDKIVKKAEGHASDINQSLSALLIDGDVKGGNSHQLLQDADIVVISVGQRRLPNMKRIDLLDTNVDDVIECAYRIRFFAPNSTVIVVTNPVDELSDVVLEITGFPFQRIISFGNRLDTARFRESIHRQTGLPRAAIECYVHGYHDENARHTWHGREDIDTQESRYMAINTIRQKGATVFAPAVCITEEIECLKEKRF